MQTSGSMCHGTPKATGSHTASSWLCFSVLRIDIQDHRGLLASSPNLQSQKLGLLEHRGSMHMQSYQGIMMLVDGLAGHLPQHRVVKDSEVHLGSGRHARDPPVMLTGSSQGESQATLVPFEK